MLTGVDTGSQGEYNRFYNVCDWNEIFLIKIWLKYPSFLLTERAMSEVNRNVCSILNKLTPQKFKPLVQQMMDLKLDTSAKLECAITLIFQKAISEPGFSVAYANMCRVLTDRFTQVCECVCVY